MNHRRTFVYLRGRGRKKVLDSPLGSWTPLRLFVSPFCLICSFWSFNQSDGSCSIRIQVVAQFKWMVLVDKVEGASISEFA